VLKPGNGVNEDELAVW